MLIRLYLNDKVFNRIFQYLNICKLEQERSIKTLTRKDSLMKIVKVVLVSSASTVSNERIRR